jgi:hypothetical protein
LSNGRWAFSDSFYMYLKELTYITSVRANKPEPLFAPQGNSVGGTYPCGTALMYINFNTLRHHDTTNPTCHANTTTRKYLLLLPWGTVLQASAALTSEALTSAYKPPRFLASWPPSLLASKHPSIPAINPFFEIDKINMAIIMTISD